jgi:hypothetical protein
MGHPLGQAVVVPLVRCHGLTRVRPTSKPKLIGLLTAEFYFRVMWEFDKERRLAY